jgi:hypothetical protein
VLPNAYDTDKFILILKPAIGTTRVADDLQLYLKSVIIDISKRLSHRDTKGSFLPTKIRHQVPVITR